MNRIVHFEIHVLENESTDRKPHESLRTCG